MKKKKLQANQINENNFFSFLRIFFEIYTILNKI